MMRTLIFLALLALHTAAAGAFPGDRAYAHLVAQCEMGPRNPGSEGHRRCAAYIRETLETAGGRVHEQRFPHEMPEGGGTIELINIIAQFGPQRAGGLLLGAHWDTRPWAEEDPDSLRWGEPILGANDGASGTALLLTLAETFAEQPPPIPIQLVFFDGEDLGSNDTHEGWIIGSTYFAERLGRQRPEAGLILDMVGSESMALMVELQARELYPDMAGLLDGIAAQLGIAGYLPGPGPPAVDDHIPLIRAGLPTLLLIDFRDPVWHTHADTPDRCSPQSLAEVGRLVDQLVRGGYFR